MEDTDDENNEIIDIKAKRISRRSSIFRRKSSLFTENRNVEQEENDKSDNLIDCVTDTEEEKRKLIEYLHDLEKENEDWKSLLRSYKARYHTLKEQKDKPQVLYVSLCSEYLTGEDKQFLSSRPDCIAIGKKLDEAIDSVKMCMKIHSDLMTVTCNTVRKAKEEMEIIKRRIHEKALENEEVQCIFDGNESVETFLSSYIDGC